MILDTYIENTRIKLGREIANPETPEKESETDFKNTQSDVLIDKHIERVTMSNRNTTVIDSQCILKEAEISTIHDRIKKDRI